MVLVIMSCLSNYYLLNSQIVLLFTVSVIFCQIQEKILLLLNWNNFSASGICYSCILQKQEIYSSIPLENVISHTPPPDGGVNMKASFKFTYFGIKFIKF